MDGVGGAVSSGAAVRGGAWPRRCALRARTGLADRRIGWSSAAARCRPLRSVARPRRPTTI